MAYVEAHAGLRDHLKTKKVARLLGIPKVQVIGHMLCLWWWCQEYAQDGDLSGFDTADIAEAAEYEGDPQTFVDALLNCGVKGGAGFLYIDVETDAMVVNDWFQYGGKLFTQRSQSATRMRNMRERKRVVTRNDSATSVTVTHIDLRQEEIRKDNNNKHAEMPSSPTKNEVVVVDDPARYRHACDMIHQNGFGMMTPILAEQVHTMLAEYPDEWIEKAFEVSVKANKRRLDYVIGVLENWRRNGFDSRQAKAPPLPPANGIVAGFSLDEMLGNGAPA
mgnify:CR=1 FL=1